MDVIALRVYVPVSHENTVSKIPGSNLSLCPFHSVRPCRSTPVRSFICLNIALLIALVRPGAFGVMWR